MYRKNGSRFAVGGKRCLTGLWHRTPANCRWIDYAARDHRQHHGSMRDHWGTRCRIAEGRASTVNLEPKPKSAKLPTLHANIIRTATQTTSLPNARAHLGVGLRSVPVR